MDSAAGIEEVEFALAKQKKLLNTVKLNNLPDKGEKLKQRVEELEKQLEQLSLAPTCSSTGVLKSRSSANGHKSSSSTNDQKSSSSTNDKNSSSLTNDQRSNSSTNDQKSNSSTNDQKLSSKAEYLAKNRSKPASSIQVQKNPTSNPPSGFGTFSSKSNLDKNNPLPKFSIKEACAFDKNREFDFLSFEQLNEKARVTDLKVGDLYQSPSFTSYRSTTTVSKYGVKLTEAKPLFEDCTRKKGNIRTIFSAIHPTSVPSDEAVQKLQDCLSVYPEDTEEATQPSSLTTSLMPHQEFALTWMLWRESQGLSGGILADDMGLGKTLTVITLVLKQKESNNFLCEGSSKSDNSTRATLVVCLASILHQWHAELRKHCEDGAFNIKLYHGTKRELEVDYDDFVLTTYQIVLNERKALLEKKKRSPLFDHKWERIILDEAHTIKNYASKTAEAIYALSGYRRWCVTGTPIHNDLKDLYSLIKFLRLDPFDNLPKWKKLLSDNSSASKERTALLVKSIILRRTKGEKDKAGKDLVTMKKKVIKNIFFELSEEEREVYKKISEAANKYVTKTPTKLNSTSNLLVMMLRLQQCCSHLSLLGQDLEDYTLETSSDDLSITMSALTIGDSPSRSGSESSLNMSFSSYSNIDSDFQSTKLQKLLEKLNEISVQSGGRDKSVIVSQWVSMLEIVEKHLNREKIQFFRISGDTKPEDRQAYADSFNTNPKACKIMLLSLKAGGVGLNLVGANHLFLLDLHWNPALEMQACDRIHRVGQTKDVTIYKFVCKNSIEEKILELQTRKSEEAAGVYEGGSKIKKGLSREDFKMLFTFRI